MDKFTRAQSKLAQENFEYSQHAELIRRETDELRKVLVETQAEQTKPVLVEESYKPEKHQ